MYIWTVFLFSSVFISCKNLPHYNNQDFNQFFPKEHTISPPLWLTLKDGIDMCTFSDKNIPLVFYGIRINLKNPQIQVTVTNPKEFIPNFEGETTLEFAKKTQSIIAINASPFNAPDGLLSRKRNVVGLAMYQRILYGNPQFHNQYAAILFMKNKQAQIISKQSQELIPLDTEFAVGGFYQILENGIIKSFPNKPQDSRTVIGIDNSGWILYILITEGEYPSKSRGMSFDECSAWLQWLGAYQGLLLDGGGSSTLVIQEKTNKYVLINQLSFPFKKGRIVANNIGFIVSAIEYSDIN